MPYNPAQYHVKDRQSQAINKLAKRMQSMQSNSSTPTSFQELTTDPASPFNGQTWLNTSSGLPKIRIAGVTKVFTVT